jgi:hypothetical protein
MIYGDYEVDVQQGNELSSNANAQSYVVEGALLKIEEDCPLTRG